MKSVKVLYVGDCEFAYTIYMKGLDSFAQPAFFDDSNYLSEALKKDASIEVSHMHTHVAFTLSLIHI